MQIAKCEYYSLIYTIYFIDKYMLQIINNVLLQLKYTNEVRHKVAFTGQSITTCCVLIFESSDSIEHEGRAIILFYCPSC